MEGTGCFYSGVNLFHSQQQSGGEANEEVAATTTTATVLLQPLQEIADASLLCVDWRKLYLRVKPGNPASESLPNKSPVFNRVQGSHCAVLDERLYIINDENKIRIFDPENKAPLELESEEKMIDIQSTDMKAYSLTEGHEMKQIEAIGIGSKPKISRVFPQLQAKISRISCGKEHILLLSNMGEVFTQGCGSRGQLGHGNIESCTEPRLLDALTGTQMIQVAAGGWHSLVLSEIGDIYSWGWNEAGQVGVKSLKDVTGIKRKDGSGNNLVLLPELLFADDETSEFDDISCGSRHSAAVSKHGQLITWGWNGYEQLCFTGCRMMDCPTLVGGIENVTGVKCGSWSTIVYTQKMKSPIEF